MPSSRESFFSSPYSSKKIDNYFEVYDKIFGDWVGKDFVFVEIGILEGGSLFMWRNFFGEQARIIGVDLNPEAKKWEKFGFEIYIGDQANPEFWRHLKNEVGTIDVVLDDGGHTNIQQKVTLIECSKLVTSGGLIVIEDTHSNYMGVFGNPSRNSFIRFVKEGLDVINSRFEQLEMQNQNVFERIWSMTFYQSIFVAQIKDQNKIRGKNIKNDGKSIPVSDFRYSKDGNFLAALRKLQDYSALGYASIGNTRKYLQFLNPLIGEAQKKYIRLALFPFTNLLKLLVWVLTWKERNGFKKYINSILYSKNLF